MDQDDQVVALDGVTLSSEQNLDEVLQRRKPGDAVPIRIVRRSGETVNATVVIEEDPRVEIVSADTVTADQQRFRDAWLNSKTR